MGLTNISVFPGHSVSWMCEVQSTFSLQFTWYLNDVLVYNDTGSSHLNNTASSTYTLYNVNYTDNSSIMRCSAAGSSSVVNSSVVYLTGKLLWHTYIQLITQGYNITHT